MEDDHAKAFCNWVRKPNDSSTKQAVETIERELQTKGVLIATPSAGGYAVPEVIMREIAKFELAMSPVRRIVKVSQTGSGDVKVLVNLRGAAAGWAGESIARTDKATSLLREVVLKGGELYSLPKASNFSLDDVFFNVEQWLGEEAGEAFAVLEGEAVLRGTGSDQYTGMLTDPPTDRDDFDSPIRNVDEYQFVSDGDSPFTIDADTLISCVYKLKSQYRAGAVWVMNSNTAGAVRKLKISDKYLWTDSLAEGQPSSLLGYRVEIWEQMDDIDVTGGSNATFPIAFGNFARGYQIADRHDLRVTVDPYSEPGFTRFYIRRRAYGAPTDTNAIKWIKTAA